jgi:hypothetical protein
MLADEV